MPALETDSPTFTPLPRREARALAIRHQAAMHLVRAAKTEADRWDLLLAVVAPSDPLLGLDSLTSSATARS